MHSLIDIPHIKVEYTPNTVFYADQSITVQKKLKEICLTDTSGEVQSKTPCPVDHRHFKCVDLGTSLLLFLAGKSIFILDKTGIDIIHHQLDEAKLGRCVTNVFFRESDSALIFGSRVRGQVQFVVYDPIEQKRLAQTSSWKMNDISDFAVAGGRIFGLLDKTFLAGCDDQTCDVLWTRFETGEIVPKILPDKGALWYACRGALKNHSASGVNTIRIPLTKISSLEELSNTTIYLTARERTALSAFDYTKNSTLWQITGSIQIQESAPIQVRTAEAKIHNALVLRLENGISIVDIVEGRTVFNTQLPEVFKIHTTPNYILAQKYSGGTYLISGIRNEVAG